MSSLLDTVFGNFMFEQLRISLAGESLKYDPDDASLQEVSTWVHENMHFLQTIFTGHGQTMWQSRRLLTSFVIEEWRQGIQQPPIEKVRIPLGHYAKASKKCMARALLVEHAAEQIVDMSRVRFWMDDPTIFLDQLAGSQLRKHWIANPVISVNGRQHVLQGKEIYEGHAKFVEATFLEYVAGTSRANAWDRSALPVIYHVALDWFLEQCGEGHYFDFPFICDLALQTTWNFIFPETEEEWRATNPSWRFVRLTEALKANQQLNVGDPSEWPQKYPLFTETLLNQCKFKSLNQVLQDCLTSLRQNGELSNFDKLMERALLFRTDTPWCGGNPIVDMNLWRDLKETFSAPAIEINGRLVGSGFKNEHANSEIVFELHYRALVDQILGDFSEQAVNDEAIECGFAKYSIRKGCEHQKSRTCSGRYRPEYGSPQPLVLHENEDVSGCTFELVLNLIGIKSQDLEIDHFAQLPTDEDLRELEKELESSKGKIG